MMLLRHARTVTEYRDAMNIQSSWMNRTRLSPRKRLNPLQKLHNRFDDVPGVMSCDSLSSLSVSSRSSQDLLLTPPRSNRSSPPRSNRSSMHRRVSWKQNAEWAIIE